MQVSRQACAGASPVVAVLAIMLPPSLTQSMLCSPSLLSIDAHQDLDRFGLATGTRQCIAASSITTVAHCCVVKRALLLCCSMQVTTTDQETAEVSPDMEPLKTLGTFRSGSLLGFNEPALISGVYFGWNLVSEPSKLRASSSYISVGDQVLVSEWRRPAPAA